MREYSRREAFRVCVPQEMFQPSKSFKKSQTYQNINRGYL